MRKLFIFSFIFALAFSAPCMADDVKLAGYTGKSLKLYVSGETEITAMVNEVSEGENILTQKGIIYLDIITPIKTAGNVFSVDLPTADWYDSSKKYNIRLSSEKEFYIIGDIDKDGIVTAEDAALILEEVNNRKAERDFSFILSDITNDGIIASDDAAETIYISAN